MSDFDGCNTTGEVRLVNSSSPTAGTVEVCYSEGYRVICDSFWDELDATVICRQLQIPLGGNEYPNKYEALKCKQNTRA